jgi:hypothetical protein
MKTMKTKSIIMTTVLSSVLCGSIFAGAELPDQDDYQFIVSIAYDF